ncbi:MAG: hypothetical protein AB7T06_27455 [Kofleriaceae bacterium]
MLLARALVLLPLASCTLFEDDPEACEVDATTELGVVYADQDFNVHVLDENGEFPLIAAPQGGFIAMLAPRMKTKTSRCRVQISAALRDMTTNLVVGLEQRPVTLYRKSDGWAIPPDPADLSDLANVAICPSSATSMIDGNPFRVEVKVVGLTTAESPSAATVGIPSCNGSQYCTSECSNSF